MDPITAILGVMGALSATSSIASAIGLSQDKKEALNLQKEHFAWMKQASEKQQQLFAQQLSAYESMFGPVEKTLANYFNNLSADAFIKSESASLSSAFSEARQRLNEDLARRGLNSSGQAMQGMTDLAFREAQAMGQLANAGEANVRQQQLGWLNVGEKRRSDALSGLSSAYNSAMSVNSNLASAYGNMATNAQIGQARAMQSVGEAVGATAAGILQQQALKPVPPGAESAMIPNNSTIAPNYRDQTRYNPLAVRLRTATEQQIKTK